MYFDEIRKKMTQTTKYFEIVDANILTTKITFYTIINLLTLATKDYLVPKKKLLEIRKAYLILNEAILNYEYRLIKLEELNDAVKKEKTLLLYMFMKTDVIITIYLLK